MPSTLACEQVLDDSELALNLLEEEADPQRFRLYWLAAVSALRSVGHVLQKVDTSTSGAHRCAIDSAYIRWKQDKQTHRIFWLFIQDERNSVLKNADASVYPISQVLSHDAFSESEVDFDIYAPMLRGPWEGEDCRDVIREAISWWRSELSLVKAAIDA